MAKIINVRTFCNRRLNTERSLNWGKLSVIEEKIDFPFEIKRIFYVYDVQKNVVRGGHRLKTAVQGLICVYGKYDIYVNDGKTQQNIILKSPDKCLILENEDWHTMKALTRNTMLLVISSKHYDVEDYIDTPYQNTPTEVLQSISS